MIDIKYPFGIAEEEIMTETGAQAFDITDNMTIIDGVTVIATGNRTINLTTDVGLKKGAQILVKSKTAATETTIFGTGITCPTIQGKAGETYQVALIFDGTTFIPVGSDTSEPVIRATAITAEATARTDADGLLTPKAAFKSGVATIIAAGGTLDVAIAGFGTTYKVVATLVSSLATVARLLVTQGDATFTLSVVVAAGSAADCSSTNAVVNWMAIKDTL